jgi:hypothetical protein
MSESFGILSEFRKSNCISLYVQLEHALQVIGFKQLPRSRDIKKSVLFYSRTSLPPQYWQSLNSSSLENLQTTFSLSAAFYLIRELGGRDLRAIARWAA